VEEMFSLVIKEWIY